MTQETITFASLGLSPDLLRALDGLKFEKPSPVQEKTIPWMLEGRDVVGLAQTGTGKTAAFVLPILQQLNPSQSGIQALIVAPTRELAIQVAEHVETLSAHQNRTQVAVLCGGQDYRPQLKKLREGVQVVVGTPGRILDHIKRDSLKLDQLSTFVLDEADEMLRMGFIEDVEMILSKLPAKKQVALFSATMPSRIRQIANRYLNDPVSVEIRMETATVKSIQQRFLFASVQQKPDALLRILAAETHQGVIVFVRTKNSTEEVATMLQQQGHRAMAIHGDLTQPLRERIITQFKQGSIDVLVATDVAARGLDVDRVTHVINYDMAHDCETYVHRIGRTGRAGRSGSTILFATPKESRMLSMIERHTRQPIEKMGVPTDAVIQTIKEERFMQAISERLQHKLIAPYRQMIENYLKANNTEANAIDVAAALALFLHHDKSWDQPAFPKPVAAAKTKDPRGAPRERERGGDKNRERFTADRSQDTRRRSMPIDQAQELFRIEVGRLHGVKPANIVGAIANEAGLQSRFITGLKIHDDHSTVYLPKGMAKEIVRELNKAWVCGRQLKITSLEGSAC